MEKFYETIIQYRRILLLVFLALFAVCFVCQSFVSVNYDMNSYLPEDSASTIALDTMEQEFDGGIPNARVCLQHVTIPEALNYKEKMEAIDGVSSVSWLDDAVNINQPLEMADADTVDTYYKDGNALFTVTIEEDKILSVVTALRSLIGEENAMTGSAVSTALATKSSVSEIRKIAAFAVLFVFVVLIITTTSWVEPFIVLLGLGMAIILNNGSNLIFGEISFVTNAAGSILQLAVSLDYSVFLIHRFEECRRKESNPEIAMQQALVQSTASILSSGLTTVIGFLALVLMRFGIGKDLGLALAKGVAISLITVFLFMPGFILASYRWMEKTHHKEFLPSFRPFGKLVRRVMVPLMLVFSILVVPSYLASNHNSFYYGSSHIFGPGTTLGDDTQKIENTFGKGDTYVLLVPKGDSAKETALSAELHDIPEITGIISFVDLAGAEIPYEYLDDESLRLLESDHYSRMVLSVDAEYEGEQTVALIEKIRETAEQYYPDTYHLAGEGVSTDDLKNTVTADMVKVNLVAIAAVFIVLFFTMRSLILPILLVLTIETSIWINLSVYYFTDKPIFYIAYLIISSIQLGATVDYAILFTSRYKEMRETHAKQNCIVATVASVTPSILTSGLVLTVVGFLLGMISTHGLLSQLGYLIGKGSLCSMLAVLFVLPGYLYLFDGWFMRNKRQNVKSFPAHLRKKAESA